MHSPTLSTPNYPMKPLHPLSLKACSPESGYLAFASNEGAHSPKSPIPHTELAFTLLPVPLSKHHLSCLRNPASLLSPIGKTRFPFPSSTIPALCGFSNHVDDQSITITPSFHSHPGPYIGPQIHPSNCLTSSLSSPSHILVLHSH